MKQSFDVHSFASSGCSARPTRRHPGGQSGAASSVDVLTARGSTYRIGM